MLTDTEIASRWETFGEPTEGGTRQFVRPLKELSESLIDALRVEGGIGLGLTKIDALTRGFRPTDLILISGFAHSGKTQIVNTMICNNPDKRILFLSLDDPGEMILAKLVAMKHNVSAEQIETQIRNDDDTAKAIVRRTAEDLLPNLFVVDEVIGIPDMHRAVDEAKTLWGAEPDAVIIDYVEMMPGTATDGDLQSTIKQKMNDLKAWAKQAPYPIIALHQGTRSNAKPGDPITMLSLGWSGEQQATIIIGVRRRRDKSEMEPWERPQVADTVTVHVVKNKRPGGKMTPHDGWDFFMNPMTGLIGSHEGAVSPAARMVQTAMEITGDSR